MWAAFSRIARARPFAKDARMFAVLRMKDLGERRRSSAIAVCLKNNGLFVDQTAFIPTLLDKGGTKVHLAAPRRFGKTVFLKLIADLCRADAKTTFEGTELKKSGFFENNNWNPPYPVLSFNFSKFGNLDPPNFSKGLMDQVKEQCRLNKFPVSEDDYPEGRLERLLNFLDESGKQPVVLVDEYDVPLLGNNEAIINELNRFFAPLKDDCLVQKFVMIGTHNVYRSIGTSTNDTFDLIRQKPFYNMLGFTREHLKEIFSDDDPFFQQHTPPNFSPTVSYEANPTNYNMEKREKLLEHLQSYYDGYRFSLRNDALSLYNPYSILQYRRTSEDSTQDEKMRKKESARFPQIDPSQTKGMEKTLKAYPRLLDVPITYYNDAKFSVGDRYAFVEHSRNLKKLWELGLLTIKSDTNEDGITLIATNLEMQQNFDNLVVENFLQENKQCFNEFTVAAAEKNFKRMAELLTILLREEEVDMHSERYMQFILFGCFKSLNLLPDIEKPTDGRKRIDIVIKNLKNVEYVFELKYNVSVAKAIEQLIEKKYCLDSCVNAKKHGKSVVGVGVSYNQKKVQILFVGATLTGDVLGYTEVARYGLDDDFKMIL